MSSNFEVSFALSQPDSAICCLQAFGEQIIVTATVSDEATDD